MNLIERFRQGNLEYFYEFAEALLVSCPLAPFWGIERHGTTFEELRRFAIKVAQRYFEEAQTTDRDCDGWIRMIHLKIWFLLADSDVETRPGEIQEFRNILAARRAEHMMGLLRTARPDEEEEPGLQKELYSLFGGK